MNKRTHTKMALMALMALTWTAMQGPANASDKPVTTLEISSPEIGESINPAGLASVQVTGWFCNEGEKNEAVPQINWKIQNAAGKTVTGGFWQIEEKVNAKACLAINQEIQVADNLAAEWHLLTTGFAASKDAPSAAEAWSAFQMKAD